MDHQLQRAGGPGHHRPPSGDKVTVTVPRGTIDYKILTIERP